MYWFGSDMTRIGFIGRTKLLYETIISFSELDGIEVSFIWTCKDEAYYDFNSKNFEDLANKLGAKFFCSSSISEFSNLVEADVVVSINFINIIPKSFIEKFKFGIINAHAGDLPRYRGNACPNWAILNNESKVVLCFHQMDEGLDSGDIIRKEAFKLSNDTYIGEVYDWLGKTVPNGFVESVRMLVEGYPVEKQKGKALRTFARRPEDSRLDFQKNLDWNYRLIRASSRPFAGAYAFLNDTDKKVTIFRAEPYWVDYNFLAVSGQLMEKFNLDKSFVIAINNQALRVTDYSVDGETIDRSFAVICKSMRNRLS
jgi:methionyl-tRNA formyltransferase